MLPREIDVILNRDLGTLVVSIRVKGHYEAHCWQVPESMSMRQILGWLFNQ